MNLVIYHCLIKLTQISSIADAKAAVVVFEASGRRIFANLEASHRWVLTLFIRYTKTVDTEYMPKIIFDVEL